MLTFPFAPWHSAPALEKNSAGICSPVRSGEKPQSVKQSGFCSSGVASMGGLDGEALGLAGAPPVCKPCFSAALPFCSERAVHNLNRSIAMTNTAPGASAPVVFKSTTLNIIDRDGRQWVTLADVARCLYPEGGNQTDTPFESTSDIKLRNLYRRHADEFGEDMTAQIQMETAGGIQDVRVFSPRGCYALGMFARTKIAKEFRVWVLDVLEGKSAAPAQPVLPHLITPEQAGELATLIAERFPEGKHRPYAWSRFNNHFRLSSYKTLPASKFADACEYIRSMPAKGDGSSSVTITINGISSRDRLMVTQPRPGQVLLTQIPAEAYVVSAENIAKIIAEPGQISKSLLPEIITAAAGRLKVTA